MKSVLFVLPATAIGGAETRFYNIIKRMEGVRSVLLTQGLISGYFDDLAIPVYLFDRFGADEPMSFSVGKTLRYARAIQDVVKREKIDCLFGIMHVGTFYAAAAKDIFHLPPPVIGSILGNISAFFKAEGRCPTFLEKMLLWYLLQRPRIIIVSSEGVREDLHKNFRVDKNKIELIPNGIDLTRVRALAREEEDLREGYNGKLIVTACRLNAQKDFSTLLRAFVQVRRQEKARLVIVGDGELRDDIFRQIKELGLEQDVLMVGFQHNPFVHVKAADVFVLSSFFEGFGNVIVEAMALGVPVVASDCSSGPGEIIQHGVNGLLVPVEDDALMATEILRLLTDDALRDLCVANGIRRAEHFNVEAMVERYERLIEELSWKGSH